MPRLVTYVDGVECRNLEEVKDDICSYSDLIAFLKQTQNNKTWLSDNCENNDMVWT